MTRVHAPLVGRAAELETLHALRARGERLVTLVGPGGVGKTRLASELVSRLSETGEQTRFVELTDARDVDDVARAVACALGLTSHGYRPDESALDTVSRALAKQPPELVVLDNVEHVLAPVVTALAPWRRAAPRTTWLSTTREPLGLRDEVVVTVPPLSLPSAPGAPSDALALLVQSAERAGWSATEASADVLVRIVHRLEGLPLALELAASWLPTLGPEGLLARLETSLALLVDRRRDAHPTKATLRASALWSWELLEPHERDAVTQCAAFRGPFDIDAAEHVIDLSSFAGAPSSLATVQALRARSIVREIERTGVRPRLALYAVVRELAAELGSRESVRDARQRHAALYAARADALAASDLEALAPDLEQLLAASEHALAVGDVDVALRALLGAHAVLLVRGPIQASAPLFARALAPDAAQGDPRLTARALLAWARVRRHTAFRDDPSDAIERALSLSRTIGDGALEAAARREIAGMHYSAGRLDAARGEYLAALGALGERGEPRARADLHQCIANVYAMEGDVDQALAHSDAGARLAELARDERLRLVIANDRAWLLVERGEHAAARDALDESRRIAAERPSVFVDATIAMLEAMLAHDSGELGTAPRFLDAAERFAGFGDALRALVCRGAAAGALATDGDPEAAAALSSVAGELDPLHGAIARAQLAALRAAAGRLDDAQAELAHAESLVAGRKGAATWVVPLLAASLDLERARRAAEDGDETTASSWSAQADDAIARVRSSHDASRPPIERTSYDARVALRLLARAPRPSLPGELGARALVVERSGRWFVPAGGERVDCEHRRALRSVLRMLAEQRLAKPGEVVPRGVLVTAAWPDERIAPAAARNRLDVVMSELRRLGLRGVIRTERGGHLLDPATPLHFAGAPEIRGP